MEWRVAIHPKVKENERIYLGDSTFHPLEVVGRGSDRQLQVGENYGKRASILPNKITNYTSQHC